jgi:hypothetical protein
MTYICTNHSNHQHLSFKKCIYDVGEFDHAASQHTIRYIALVHLDESNNCELEYCLLKYTGSNIHQDLVYAEDGSGNKFKISLNSIISYENISINDEANSYDDLENIVINDEANSDDELENDLAHLSLDDRCSPAGQDHSENIRLFDRL